ncbi:MAG: hypothetical protein WC807_19385, partial [Hyphomicrobium sp.]
LRFPAGILFSLRAAATPTLRADTNRTASALRAVGIMPSPSFDFDQGHARAKQSWSSETFENSMPMA